MIIYTMGFTQKSAEEFFEKVINNKIEIVVDVRLNNQSQLAGFSKGRDLKFFLEKIAQCEYDHEVSFAPTKELLNAFKKGEKSWNEYVEIFHKLIVSRKMVSLFASKYKNYNNVLLLCSEKTPEECLRRLLAEAINKELNYEIKHL